MGRHSTKSCLTPMASSGDAARVIQRSRGYFALDERLADSRVLVVSEGNIYFVLQRSLPVGAGDSTPTSNSKGTAWFEIDLLTS